MRPDPISPRRAADDAAPAVPSLDPGPTPSHGFVAGEGMSAATAAPAAGTAVRRLSRVPLLPKLVVADLGINVLAFVVLRGAPAQWAAEILIASLFVTLVLNGALVWWALLPLRSLETAAARVSQGDLAARVPRSRFADRNIARIGETLNQLLDKVTADRRRVRALASQVISAGDQERAHIARELHDSTAQQLSALEMLVTASVREVPPGALQERLGVMREIVTEALGEVRTLSHNVHPRVLDDLGLAAALEFLARRTRESSGVRVRVASDLRRAIPVPVASVLYRVAQEAVRNAVRHGRPHDLVIALTADARPSRRRVTAWGCS